MLILLPAGAVAALGQALIPYYTGQIIDYASIDQKFDDFQRTCLLLIAVAFGTAVFTGDLTSSQYNCSKYTTDESFQSIMYNEGLHTNFCAAIR